MYNITHHHHNDQLLAPTAGAWHEFYLAMDSKSGHQSGVVDQVVVGWSPSAACLDGIVAPCPGAEIHGWLLRRQLAFAPSTFSITHGIQSGGT